MFAQIALPIPKRSLFTYKLPPDMEAEPGSLVLVPVARTERVGVVWQIQEKPSWSGGEIRSITELLTKKPLLDRELLFLLDWISRYYLRPIGSVVSVAMPGHLRFKRHQNAIWRGEGSIDKLNASHKPIAEAIQQSRKKQLTIATLEKKFGRQALKSRLKTLATNKIITIQDEWRTRYDTDEPTQPITENLNHSQTATVITKQSSKLTLNPQQMGCVEAIVAGITDGKFTPFLLHGVTGSGKTEVYFQAVDACLAQNKQALLLVPEISLTPQLEKRYRDRFQVKLAIFHSDQSDKQRFEHWVNIRDGNAQVVIGARSAIFAPFDKLGLVVVDEEHDGSYKQEGNVPYQGRDMAVVRAKQAGATLVLGSATPSLESLVNAEAGRYTLLVLSQRATGAKPPKIEIIHLGGEELKDKMSRMALISPPLVTAINETLDKKQQVLLFLNRRGYAPSLLCRQCGQAVMCPNCSVTLTFHRGKSKLVCHYCDFWQGVMDICPKCGQLSLFHFGPGTEQLEKEAIKKFPNARIARIDRDSVSSGEIDLTTVLEGFRDRKLDILLGTQMIAKGHHFPHLALVGVVQAETSLCQPDFRSSERTFQLLTQVAGRAGREEEIPGRVLVQTFDPNHYAIRAVMEQNLAGFVATEKEFRNIAQYPPYLRMALLRVSSTVQKNGELFCQQLREKLQPNSDVIYLGPAPAPIFKLRNRFRWQLLIKENPGGKLHRALTPLMSLAEELAGSRLRVEMDVDPHSFL
ncbi:MAG: primosomal protein N' [Magnetococcales bacterium]|nr:primosomal protein N' [Magnetococcales bacterium]